MVAQVVAVALSHQPKIECLLQQGFEQFVVVPARCTDAGEAGEADAEADAEVDAGVGGTVVDDVAVVEQVSSEPESWRGSSSKEEAY